MRFLLLVLLCCVSYPNASFGQKDVHEAELRVRHFPMKQGFAAHLLAPGIAEILNLVEDQNVEIQSICAEMENDATAIKRDPALDARAKLEKLRELQGTLDQRLRAVLLPHQIRMMNLLPVWYTITREGLSNSLARGFLAGCLELTVEERREVKQVAKAVLEKYKEAIIDAQKKAIKELRDSIPKSKQDDFDEILEPFLTSLDMLWKPDCAMLSLDRLDPRLFRRPKKPQGK